MIEVNNNIDASLLVLRPCDSEHGFNSIRLAVEWERICPHCGNPYLREVFVSGDNIRNRQRVQCHKCLSRTLNVPTFLDFTDAFKQFRKGWFWNVDNEGYPVFGNGQRVDPSYL